MIVMYICVCNAIFSPQRLERGNYRRFGNSCFWDLGRRMQGHPKPCLHMCYFISCRYRRLYSSLTSWQMVELTFQLPGRSSHRHCSIFRGPQLGAHDHIITFVQVSQPGCNHYLPPSGGSSLLLRQNNLHYRASSFTPYNFASA